MTSAGSVIHVQLFGRACVCTLISGLPACEAQRGSSTIGQTFAPKPPEPAAVSTINRSQSPETHTLLEARGLLVCDRFHRLSVVEEDASGIERAGCWTMLGL